MPGKHWFLQLLKQDLLLDGSWPIQTEMATEHEHLQVLLLLLLFG
jgi:hypothetical protein